MDYDFLPGTKPQTLVLFHGTGGSKEDLIPIARLLDQEANILALEGEVDEMGMKRFFKRIRPGVFDEADLKSRAISMTAFLNELATRHNLDKNAFIGIGYSNGANMLAALLYEGLVPFKALFLHHPMVPYKTGKPVKQNDLPVFIGAGKNDEICPSDQSMALAKLLNAARCTVDIHWHDSGHQLTQGELDAAGQFYRARQGKRDEE